MSADFGRGMLGIGKVPHQNRLCFSLLLSFAEAKESRGCFVTQANNGNICPNKRKYQVLRKAKKGNRYTRRKGV
jgi:hypothetical protein